ncbi:MAG: 2-amino-4-hydroxy-6-hydroxymethyldihydropteridine diphosphokinase [Natronospirillum sp.]
MRTTYYYFSIGSNIAPESHIPKAIDAFAAVFGAVTLGRFFRTPPVGMVTDSQFINGCFAVGVEQNFPLSQEWFDRLCKVIEIQHGRPIDQPGRHKRNRTLDIDYLFNSHQDYQAITADLEAYAALDLDHLLNLLEDVELPAIAASDDLLRRGHIQPERSIHQESFGLTECIRFLW